MFSLLRKQHTESTMDHKNSKKIQEIISLVLDLEADEPAEKIRKITCRKWDSVAQVNMIVAIESEFNIEFSPQEMERFTSYESIIILLDEKM